MVDAILRLPGKFYLQEILCWSQFRALYMWCVYIRDQFWKKVLDYINNITTSATTIISLSLSQSSLSSSPSLQQLPYLLSSSVSRARNWGERRNDSREEGGGKENSSFLPIPSTPPSSFILPPQFALRPTIHLRGCIIIKFDPRDPCLLRRQSRQEAILAVQAFEGQVDFQDIR